MGAGASSDWVVLGWGWDRLGVVFGLELGCGSVVLGWGCHGDRVEVRLGWGWVGLGRVELGSGLVDGWGCPGVRFGLGLG